MPDWFKVFKKVGELVQQARKSDDAYVPPRCYIDGSAMRRLGPDEPRFLKWRDSDLPVFRCPDEHEFSPGNYAGGINPPPPEGAGPHGEI